MSHFYGSMIGKSGEATRSGTVASGMTAHVRGWDAGVKVAAYDYEGCDTFAIYATHGSNDPNTGIIIGWVKRIVTPLGESVIFEAAPANDTPQLEAAAQQAGYEHGLAAGSWVTDGNTTDDTCRALLAGIEDGDPMILDQLPSSPLSGEWAGDPTPQSVLEALDVYDDDERADDLLRAYEDGFARGVEEEVVRSCKAVL